MPEKIDRAPATIRRPGPPPWTWMILACALVGASGLVRVHQERLFADAARDAQVSPFQIKELPKVVGNWVRVGEDMQLEAQTLQIAGCTDYMYRNYSDERTGVTLTVLVAFGPAIRVFPHSPDVCFPANGYELRGGPRIRNVEVEGPGPEDGSAPKRTVPFKASAYGKDGGGSEELREVYYTFWHDGRWDPEAAETKNRFQHRPALFKVQVERSINPNEINAPSSSIENFVASLIPEIDRRIERKPGGDGLAAADDEREATDRGETASE